MAAITQKVAITRQDGGVSIMAFVVEGRGSVLPSGAVWFSDGIWAREPSDANIQDEISRAVPDALSWRRVTDADIPADRTYRDALRDDGETLAHHMPTAREIHLQRLRHERAAKLPQLDVAWMRHFAAGDVAAAAAIEAQKQTLRDMPQTLAPVIAAAQTPDDLKAIGLPE